MRAGPGRFGPIFAVRSTRDPSPATTEGPGGASTQTSRARSDDWPGLSAYASPAATAARTMGQTAGQSTSTYGRIRTVASSSCRVAVSVTRYLPRTRSPKRSSASLLEPSEWPRDADGTLGMILARLDLGALLAELEREPVPSTAARSSRPLHTAPQPHGLADPAGVP
ncbi:MAG: hypothetical protein AVDCRST_MAG19-2486 [uncultured Thermomicrobiales bacterium]|uniref:Uncharacterized protein n=1 Tax=uncultured Thermomicrobiales bacterium TaxID=1645740 RepID=A0A6J4V4C6_9BACT|nr:MAG: hypothetical protein AVDCRST_MAG19-2486 [uncultured Thermomicrobiales bacterium]